MQKGAADSARLLGGNNEQLEFLGDAVLTFVLSYHLFLKYVRLINVLYIDYWLPSFQPYVDEGNLTTKRSKLENNDFLATVAVNLQFTIYPCTEVEVVFYYWHQHKYTTLPPEYANMQKSLADCVEAFIGFIAFSLRKSFSHLSLLLGGLFIDQGLKCAADFIMKFIVADTTNIFAKYTTNLPSMIHSALFSYLAHHWQ